jgi:2-aminoadipate transaminase
MDCIVEVMAAEGMHVEPDDLLVTTGGQQVIDLVVRTLIDPGDVVIAEAPTYPGCRALLRVLPGRRRADRARRRRHADRPDGETLDRLRSDGRTPKFIYTVPSFQNPPASRCRWSAAASSCGSPRTASSSSWRTTRTACCATRATAPDAVRARRGEYVAYLGTFSKILSPGLRLGWCAAPRPVLERLNAAKAAADLCSAPLAQHFVAAYFREHDWRSYVRTLSELYRRRRDTMLDALAEHLPPEATWTRPEGGLFIWATLPDYIDTTDLLGPRAARERRVRARPRRVPRRARRLLDAAELLGRRRGRHPRGRARGSARSCASRSRSTRR